MWVWVREGVGVGVGVGEGKGEAIRAGSQSPQTSGLWAVGCGLWAVGSTEGKGYKGTWRVEQSTL